MATIEQVLADQAHTAEIGRLWQVIPVAGGRIALTDNTMLIQADHADRGDGTFGPETWLFRTGFETPQAILLSPWTADEIAQAAQVTGANGKNVEANWPLIWDAMKAWEIATPAVAAGLVGTISKESGSFAPVREAYWLSEAARWAYYRDTTKHAPYGGGPEYHGRGFVQITHVGNYQAAQDALNAKLGLGLDLVGNPDQALDGPIAAHILCWFFVAKGLVPLCEARNWVEIRRRVWGAYGDVDGVSRLQFAAGLLIPLALERGFTT